MNGTGATGLRVALIGAGTIAQSVHIPTIRRAGMVLHSVCDLSPSRAREIGALTGTRHYTDPGEAVADPGADAVLIASTGSHAALTKAAVEAGKHVLVEKPVALTLREVDELVEAAATRGVVVQAGYMKMYDPLMATARDQLAQLHAVRLVRITVAHPDDQPQVDHLRMPPPPTDADPAAIAAAQAYEQERIEEALPGAPAAIQGYYRDVLNGSVVHELSMLRALGLPLPQRWHAEAFPEVGPSAPASLLAHAAVGDARYVLSWNWLPEYPEYTEELAVLASNGRIAFDVAKPYLLESRSRLRVRRHEGLQRQDTTYTDGFETGFLRQLDAFARSIVDGEPVVSDLAGAREDIRQLQRLAQAIGRSRGHEFTTEEDPR